MKINKNVSISENGFVFNPTTGESFTVNPIGTEIINFLKMSIDDDGIKANIIEKYAIDGATFERDYYDFIQMLKSYSLLETTPEE